MIAFGALSGGIASELSGGNFWEGAITGGIVAGLNHAMHKMQSKTLMEQEFEKANLNPNDKKVEGRSSELISKLPSLSKLNNAIIDKGGVVLIADVYDGNAGSTNPDTYQINININAKMNSTLLGYAFSIGHELVHSFDWQFNMTTWSRALGAWGGKTSALTDLREIRAYNWMKSMGYKLQGLQIPFYNNAQKRLRSEYVQHYIKKISY